MDERIPSEGLDAALERIIRDHRTVFQHHFFEFLAAHLSDCCEVFDGDLHEMLVLTILAQRYLREQVTTPEEAGLTRDERRSISATRIASQSGIPRETVRRKLASLQARGWIEKTERSEWRIVFVDGEPVAKVNLEDFLRREIRRVAKLARALKSFV